MLSSLVLPGGDQWEKPVEKRNQSLYVSKFNQSMQESRGTRYASATGYHNDLSNFAGLKYVLIQPHGILLFMKKTFFIQ